ncbi:MAG: DUF72 domain-containing protein [Arcicella sp.]|jgi:uncharacterized protein YecE (DUF72 family)|nr:DUF72 domain-containing protein [Arcicella sp.]
MDFGKISKYEVNKTDFTLKPDNPFNIRVLQQEQVAKPLIKVGCPVWANKDWNGKIYPNSAKTQDFLKLYSQQFNTIELNVTHYQIPNDETIERWYSESDPDFTFCPKFPQVISHDKLLQNVEGLTDEFCNQILKLDSKLGMPFLQVAPYFTPRQAWILEKFLKKLPKHLKIAVEFRHEDWFKDDKVWQETLAMLNGFGHATVITDVAGRRDVVHQSLSVSKAVIRWVGNEHPSDYQRIDEWVQRIKTWLEAGLEELWLFVHICENTIAPEMATYWIQQLNKHCNLDIIEPKFLPKVEQMSLF